MTVDAADLQGPHGLCQSYCEHGGVCGLDAGHDGLHSNGFCPPWSDAQSITREAADARLLQQPNGRATLDSIAILENLAAMTRSDDNE